MFFGMSSSKHNLMLSFLPNSYKDIQQLITGILCVEDTT